MYRTGRFHDGERYVAVLAREGRTRLHLTFIDDAGVRHSAEPLEAARYLEPLVFKGKPYPVDRMVRRLRAFGRERGVTVAAKNELDQAA